MAKCDVPERLALIERGGTAMREALHVLDSGVEFEKARSSLDDTLTRIIWSKGSKVHISCTICAPFKLAFICVVFYLSYTSF